VKYDRYGGGGKAGVAWRDGAVNAPFWVYGCCCISGVLYNGTFGGFVEYAGVA
jgi:hypothetical protein